LLFAWSRAPIQSEIWESLSLSLSLSLHSHSKSWMSWIESSKSTKKTSQIGVNGSRGNWFQNKWRNEASLVIEAKNTRKSAAAVISWGFLSTFLILFIISSTNLLLFQNSVIYSPIDCYQNIENIKQFDGKPSSMMDYFLDLMNLFSSLHL
jgi:hypothetical protein